MAGDGLRNLGTKKRLPALEIEHRGGEEVPRTVHEPMSPAFNWNCWDRNDFWGEASQVWAGRQKKGISSYPAIGPGYAKITAPSPLILNRVQ